ncbi:MAG TPA: copper-binding protein [Polyangiaceae bacterium]|jgi:protein SCO1/2|nr:copper-binding protein [Polyangiaceae bacterium]
MRIAPLALAASLVVGGGLVVLAPRLPLGVTPAYGGQSYAARGTVQSIAGDRKSVTIAHEAIPGFMPAMTMAFEARSPDQLAGLHEGDRVTFSFTVTDDARRLIDSIARATKSR